MATYIRETVRNRTLHLLRLDTKCGDATVYLDASRRIKDALRADREDGYKNGGPRTGVEVERAREYADYCDQYVTTENLYQFYAKGYGYVLFSDKDQSENAISDIHS